MRKSLALLPVLLLLLFAAVLTACGDDDDGGGNDATAASDGGDEQKTIYINQFAKGLRAFTRRSEGIIARADEEGWEVLDDAYGDATPETQIQQIQDALIKRPDAIFLIPINPEALTPVITQAKEQGIAVITMGSNLADPSQVVSFVSYEPEDLGKRKADFIAKALNGKGRVGVVNGVRGADFAEGQKAGLEEEFAKYPDIELVDGGYNNWSSDEGLKSTENLLSRGDLDAVYFANDDLAVGGIQAIKERGLDPAEVITVGSDAAPAALESIRRGELTYTTSSCSFAAGQLAAEQLARFWAGETPPAVVPVTQVPITKENIDEVLARPKEECGS
jgi:ribose transport system substrate-binding protein